MLGMHLIALPITQPFYGNDYELLEQYGIPVGKIEGLIRRQTFLPHQFEFLIHSNETIVAEYNYQMLSQRTARLTMCGKHRPTFAKAQ